MTTNMFQYNVDNIQNAFQRTYMCNIIVKNKLAIDVAMSTTCYRQFAQQTLRMHRTRLTQTRMRCSMHDILIHVVWFRFANIPNHHNDDNI